jgi:hypothetical protein
MIKQTQIGILLLNWNNETNIIPLVSKLSQWKNRPSIIIVDNASDIDISRLIINIGQDISVINSPINRGFSGGNNLGLEFCIKNNFEYVLLLNHDAQITEEIVYTLLEVLDNDKTIGVIGPCIEENANRYSGGRNIARYPNTRTSYDLSSPLLLQTDYVPGMACILRTSTLKKVGIFDERYFFSGEVADLCRRVKNIGYKCIIHTGYCIRHDTGHDTLMREKIHLYYSIRNRFLYINKHEQFQSFWMLFWIFFGSILMVHAIIHKKPHSAKSVLLGIRDGLVKRFGDHNEYFIY